MPSRAEHATAVAPRGPAPATPDGVEERSKDVAYSRGRAFARAAGVMVVVLVADRISKSAVVSGIAVGDVHKFLPGVQLVHVRNSGVAFGFLSGGGALVLIVTLAALSALLCYFLLRPQRPLLWLPTGLLLGGALGNLIDRVSSGSVTDFIKFPLWPAFNLADTAITCGVLSLLYVLEGPRSKGERDPDTGRS